VTFQAIGGLVVFNVLLFLLGASVLWTVRGWASAASLVPAAGVAYLVGVAVFMIVGTVQIVVGVPISPASMALGCLLVPLAGAVIAAAHDRRAPSAVPAMSVTAGAPPKAGARRFHVVGLALAAVAFSFYFVLLFRAARFMPVHEWDGWWVWTIRAKAIYYDGDLGYAGLVLGSVYPSYPPGLSVLYAGAMESMGQVDTVTLHLQNWFLALGFSAAFVGVLAGHVRAWIALPTALLVTTLPALTEQAPLFHADALLAYQIAIAVVLLLLWLDDGETWRCVAASLLLVGALMTKRDGILFVACALLALFVASWWQRRWAWPRLTLVAAAVVAVSSAWWLAYQPRPDKAAPSGGASALLDDPGRFGAALRLTFETMLDTASFSLIAGIGALALLLAAVAGGRRLVVFALVFVSLSLVGIAAAIAAELRFEISRDPILSPVDRLVLVPVVVLGAVLPLLLEAAASGNYRERIAGRRAGAPGGAIPESAR
jgi:hypothetical protein